MGPQGQVENYKFLRSRTKKLPLLVEFCLESRHFIIFLWIIFHHIHNFIQGPTFKKTTKLHCMIKSIKADEVK